MNTEEQLKLKSDINAESATHNDVILINFIDSYRNSTYKILSALRWLNERCLIPAQRARLNARWPRMVIIRADDSTLVDAVQQLMFVDENLTRNLKKCPNMEEKAFFCDLRVDSTPVFDDSNSPWFVTREEWPEGIYPTYCAGALWTMTVNLLAPIMQAANKHLYFYIEDVFVTGVLGQASRARYYNWNKFVTYDDVQRVLN